MKKNKRKIFYFDDEFIKETLAKSAKATLVETSHFRKNPIDFSNSIFFIRGVTNNKYCVEIIKNNSIFFYIDTGYFGNINSYYGIGEIRKKYFHRVVLNKMQLNTLTHKDDKRYLKILEFIKKDYGVSEKDFLKPWKVNGSKILICPPSDKVASVFGIKNDKWITDTVEEIKKYSDREIIIRTKPQSRSERVGSNPIQSVLDDNIFILVTYNSIAATEAIIHGIPAITLGPNAASNVSINNIKDIEQPIYPDRQLWLNNLAYGQFHVSELKDGTAWEYLQEQLG
jgi:hypothetical protein